MIPARRGRVAMSNNCGSLALVFGLSGAWLLQLKNGRHGYDYSCTCQVFQTRRFPISYRCSSPCHLGQCVHKAPRALAGCRRHHQLSLEYVQYPYPQLYSPAPKDLLASKSGVSPAKLRVVAQGVEYNFIFSGPEPANMTDRDAFKDKLKPLLRASMQAKTPAASTPTPLKPEGAPTKDSPAEVPSVSQNQSSSKGKAVPRPVTAPPENVQSPQTPTLTPGLDPVKARLSAEYSARKDLLKNNPELAALHAAVVLRGSVSEADFWAHRQVRFILIPVPGCSASLTTFHVPR